MAKSTAAKSSKSSNKGRVVARFTKEDSGKKLSVTLNKNSVSVFLVDGEGKGADRKRATPKKYDNEIDARAAFDQFVSTAEQNGWTRLRKTYDVESLLAE